MNSEHYDFDGEVKDNSPDFLGKFFIFVFLLMASMLVVCCIDSASASSWANDGYDAGSFNGVNSYVNIINSQTLNFSINSSISVSAWIKTTKTTREFIVSKHNGGTNGVFYLNLNQQSSNDVSFVVENSTGTQQTVSFLNSNVNDGNWHFLLGTADNVTKNITLYVDNVKTSNNFANFDRINSVNIPSSIGMYYNGGVYDQLPFNGSIDQVQIFNRSLSQAEITQLYNNGQTNPVCNLITDGQVLCIDFDDYSLADKSGNGNNGINTNVTFTQIQGNYNTLVEGVDYTLDKTTGLLTLLNPNLVYNYVLAVWDYKVAYGFHVSILKLLAGLIIIIVLVVSVIILKKEIDNLE